MAAQDRVTVAQPGGVIGRWFRRSSRATNEFTRIGGNDASHYLEWDHINNVLNAAGSGSVLKANGVTLGSNALTSTAPAVGIGYATGAGAAVSQATDRTTGVTINAISGAITTQATSLAAGAEVSFTVTNSSVAIGDVIIAVIRSGPTTSGSTWVSVTGVAAGSFQLTLSNLHASVADTGAAIINFAVIKAVSA